MADINTDFKMDPLIDELLRDLQAPVYTYRMAEAHLNPRMQPHQQRSAMTRMRNAARKIERIVEEFVEAYDG